MPAPTGQCINFGLCNKADSREVLTIAMGEELVCPECGQPLQPSQAPRGGFHWRSVSVAMALVVIALAVHWLWPNPGGHSGVHAAVDQGSVILRLSGSDRLGSALAPALAGEFLKQRGARDVKTVPGAKEGEVRVQGILPGESSPKSIEIHSHGAETAFEDLAKGACDIGMSSRRAKPEEAAQLAKIGLGDMMSPASEHVVALDAIAVIVNPKNPVESLTKKQVEGIFAGEISDWSQAGGSGGAINVYVRDESSDTYFTFKTLVLGDRPLAGGALRIKENRELTDDVGKDPNGIGVLSLHNVRNAKTVAISEGGARSFSPNQLNVATEDYPLTRRLTLFTPANPPNDLTRKFVELALSRQGQEIVEKNGFVGQNVSRTEQVVIPTGAPEEYQRLTSGADRLSLNFRFRSGNAELDSKALVDLDRTVSFLTDLHFTGNKILLFGFADATGPKPVNVALSKNRADAVASEFDRRGMKPETAVGFGSQLPVASNDTLEGREKNRRVEIWLKK